MLYTTRDTVLILLNIEALTCGNVIGCKAMPQSPQLIYSSCINNPSNFESVKVPLSRSLFH